MSEFVACVDAITAGAISLKVPVISGNVSFYNETMGQNITSTPATGLVGLRESVDNLPEDRFTEEGLSVFWIQTSAVETSGLYADEHNLKPSFSGSFDVETQTQFVKAMLEVCKMGEVQASQVVGGGGMVFTLAQMCLDGLGFESFPALSELPIDRLVAERMYEVVLVTRDPAKLQAQLTKALSGLDVQIVEIGRTGGNTLSISKDLQFSVSDLKAKSSQCMKPYFAGVSP